MDHAFYMMQQIHNPFHKEFKEYQSTKQSTQERTKLTESRKANDNTKPITRNKRNKKYYDSSLNYRNTTVAEKNEEIGSMCQSNCISFSVGDKGRST